MKFLICILCVIGGQSLFARIGETEAQVDTRYGKPERVDTEKLLLRTKLYRVKDLRVSVVFVDGVSECEHFSKPEHAKLTDQEAGVILEANAAPKPWVIKFETLRQKIWAITDPTCGDSADCVLRLAVFDVFDGQLMITSKKFMDREKTLTAEDAKKKLKDF